ncbi:uncharacterized protein LOC111269322 isoform X2 [Varroa jacobsoni]|uniref:uncharacterized protein LOC111269322 isoform X2 n=1 Tax=Varroa jacobsoni TaxID=62625 RepID=UPI000BF34832|nr:uncharacterized protein LOC111269322 isoform X2 [Varroa jacobsoni]
MSLEVLKGWWLHLTNSWHRTTAATDWSQDVLKPDHMTIVVSALTASAVLVIVICKFLWPVLPVRVRCWFCGGLNRLPLANRNHFDCLHCEQYNGFSALGDYNKDIPAQRDPRMNVFSVGATPSGKTLKMYHNGLCELCNHRQAIKVKCRNQFEPKDSVNEETEFKEYCRRLETIHPLCTACKNHVRTRLAYQDAKLLPHVMSLEASRWYRRLERFINSELTELIVCAISAISFAPLFDEGWTRLVPFSAALVLILSGVVHNRALLWTIILRSVSVAVQLTMNGSTLLPVVTSKIVHPLSLTVLNAFSIVCGLVAFVKPIESFIARLCGRKRPLLKATFTALPDLSKALAPLLSPAYRTFLRTRDWTSWAPFDLGSRISSLSLGSARRSSPGFGMSASTFGPIKPASTPRAYSDLISGLFGGRRSSGARSNRLESLCNISPFENASGPPRNASVLRPSRLSDLFDRRQNNERKRQKCSIKQSQFFEENYNNLTPPPSQDSSLTSSEASRQANSFYNTPTQYQRSWPHTEIRSGLNGLVSGKSEYKDWDARTTHTVYSTVIHEHNGSSAKALWAIAFLLATALLKLCWADLTSLGNAVFMYSATLAKYFSLNGDVVCPAQ